MGQKNLLEGAMRLGWLFFFFTVISISSHAHDISIGQSCEDILSFGKEAIADFSTNRGEKTLTKPGFNSRNLKVIYIANKRILLGRAMGSGLSGTFYRRPKTNRGIKIPHSMKVLPTFDWEIEGQREAEKGGLSVAKIITPRISPFLIEKEIVEGDGLDTLVNEKRLQDFQVDALAQIFICSFENQLPIDHRDAANFVWSKEKQDFVDIDPEMMASRFGKHPKWPDLGMWLKLFGTESWARSRFVKIVKNTLGVSVFRDLEVESESRMNLAHSVKNHQNELIGY